MRAYKDAVYPRIIHYISDLHLTHKIKEKIEKGLSHKEAINRVVKKAVRDIEKSISECESNLNRSWESQVLLIGGDVSFDFNISKIFYKTLASSLVIKKKNVYAILGNHELWGGNPDIITNQGCDEIIEKYRLLFEECGITFLENQVAVVVSDNSFDIERYVLAVDFILNKDNQDAIERLIEKSRYVICGGIAFSGNNERFNVRNGIYRNAVNSREDEIRRSQKYDLLLRKVSELAKDRPIISLTHMPKEDWLQEADYDNCVYISGHTHKNIRSEEDIKVYADNQVGYKCNRYLTKQFIIDAKYDIFESYPDGVHRIERVDYSEFGKGIGLYLSFRHDPNSQIYLLKRDGIYMFVSESKNGLSILSGGRRKRLSRKDLNYYYANMSAYAELLKTSFEGYEKYINDVSNKIKRLGGSGRIHGCIVDVDFLNHIYVNPYDGTVTCYYAEDVNSRLVFSNLADMLETNISNSEVLDEIKNKFLQVGDNNNLVAPNVNLLNFGSHYISTGTYLYRPSERVNKIHRLFNYRVLQIWDESADVIQIGEGTRNEIKTYAFSQKADN